MNSYNQTFFVSQENIKKGKRHDSCNCPIALAVKDVIATQRRIAIDFGFIAIDTPNGFKTLFFSWPSGVSDFISRFDSGLPVSPFYFTLTFHQEDIEVLTPQPS